MIRSKNINLTEGPLLRSVILYSIPIILSGILQIFFNAADLAIVGNFADPDRATAATAAVGATGSFIALVVNTVMGLSNGVNVVLARSLGARERERSSRIVHTAVLLSFLCGVGVGIVGFFLSPFAMRVTDCPENARQMAVNYLRIYFAGCPGIFVYNFGSAILRTKGDTRRPLYFLTLSGLVNVLLNLFFVLACGLDAEGVALATTLSQYLAAGLTLLCLCRQEDETRIILSRLRLVKSELMSIIRYGVPAGLTNAVYSFSNVQIQSGVNSFGESAVAGSAASGSLEGFVMAVVSAMNAAVIAFTGQNVGARKPKRARRSIVTCLLLAIAFSLILGWTIYLLGGLLYRIYVPNDAVAIHYASERSAVMMTTYVLLAALNILGGATQALGYAMTITLISVVGIFGLRTLWMNVIYPMIGTFQSVFLCFPISWALICISNGIALLIALRRFEKKGAVK